MHARPPSLSSVADSLQNCASFAAVQKETSQCLALQKLPYRAVQVDLSDGSTFRLEAVDLVAKAALKLKIPGLTAQACLMKQVIPLLQEYPDVLLEVAGELSWREAQALAQGAFWKSPCELLPRLFQSEVRVSPIWNATLP